MLGIDMLFPDSHVTGCDASIRAEHKDNGMGPGQHADGQFGFRAKGVQARSIKNAQAALEQGVANADLGITPGRYQHITGIIAIVFQHGLVEAQLPGLFRAHALDPGNFCQHFAHDVRIALVELMPNPLFRLLAQLLQRQIACAGFDREQKQIVLVGAAIKKQLGRTHGGAPGLGWQHALAVFREKQGVDQLRLATGVFTNKSDGQLILNEQLQSVTNTGADVF